MHWIKKSILTIIIVMRVVSITQAAEDIILPEKEYIVIGPRLIPDYDRNGIINNLDRDQQSANNPYRFWVNDDDDDGYDGGSDIPGAPGTERRDWKIPLGHSHHRIDGVRDFIDFFPVYLDIQEILALRPASEYDYILKHGDNDGSFNALINSGLTSLQANHHLENGVFCESHATAILEHISSDGYNLSDNTDFINDSKNGKSVILLECRHSTEAPLVLEIKKGDTIIYTVEMPIKTSGVEAMYRHKNLRPDDEGHDTNTSEPTNYPDSLCNDKNVIFIHGVNVTAEGARGWSSEMYKRLYWSGSKAKFHGITYHADAWTPANYHGNVMRAFNASAGVSSYIQNLSGAKTIIAHSMGNIVASSAIQDGLIVNKYIMLDAAVATECYDESTFSDVTNNNYMVHGEWRNYTNTCWTSTWHKLFSENDNRSKLTWKNRFSKAVPMAYNFYSSEDEVFDIYTNVLHYITGVDLDFAFKLVDDYERYTWQKQEMFKGCDGRIVHWPGTTRWAGWGFNRTPILGNIRYTAEEAALLSESKLRCDDPDDESVFRDNPDEMFSSSITKQLQNEILAKGIPALSHSAGKKSIHTLPSTRNINIAANKMNNWPRNHETYKNSWLHNDIREMSYLYTFKAFDEMVNMGGIK